MLILIYNVMKKIMILVGALFMSVASHAIWFHTSCGYSEYKEFSSTDEEIAYMQELEAIHCSDADDEDGKFPEENPGEI